MNIDSIFPETGGVLSLSLHLGGSPLADILAHMMDRIRQQQRELDALRRDAGDRFQRSEERLCEHDAALRRISDDLRLDMRPIYFQGHAPMPSTADALGSVGCRVARIEHEARRRAVDSLCATAQRQTIASHFSRWAEHRRRRAAARQLCATLQTDVLWRYMRKWRLFVPLRAKQVAQRRHVLMLRAGNDRRVAMQCWSHWSAVAASRRSDDETARRIALRSLAARGLSLWRRRLYEKSIAQGRARALAQRTARELARRFLQRWARGHMALFAQHSAMGALRSRISRDVARQCLALWVKFAEVRRERRRVHARVPHMHHANVAAIARRYFNLLGAFCRMRREGRARQAMEKRLGDVHERADVLQRQLDVGLETLAHTNSVLARVVDNVMIVDEPIGRKIDMQNDLQAVGMARSPGRVQGYLAHKTVPSPSPSADRERMSASDVLRHLRSRLDQTYRSTTSVSHGRL